nr:MULTISPECIES: AraC family transcriptional regulator ligand-binding domain-containing protein [unclassified Variovorax]
MTLARLPFNMLDGLHKAGINLDEVAAPAGLETDGLRKSLTSAQADRVFVLIYEKAGNPAAGLAVGLQPMRSELFGVVGFAGMLSSDFGAALARIARYNALVSACQMDLHAGADECEARIRYDGPLRPYSRSCLDMQMGTLLTFGRTFTERAILPVRVTLKERPLYHALYAGASEQPASARSLRGRHRARHRPVARTTLPPLLIAGHERARHLARDAPAQEPELPASAEERSVEHRRHCLRLRLLRPSRVQQARSTEGVIRWR